MEEIMKEGDRIKFGTCCLCNVEGKIGYEIALGDMICFECHDKLIQKHEQKKQGEPPK
jgi:hypothetical protein